MKVVTYFVYVATQTLLVIAFLVGIWFLFRALTTPSGYSLSIASAVQVTQVYSEATYYGVVAGACFLFAILLHISTNIPHRRSQERIEDLNNEMLRILKYMGRTQQQSASVLGEGSRALRNRD